MAWNVLRYERIVLVHHALQSVVDDGAGGIEIAGLYLVINELLQIRLGDTGVHGRIFSPISKMRPHRPICGCGQMRIRSNTK
jgi:hypothetical protein